MTRDDRAAILKVMFFQESLKTVFNRANRYPEPAQAVQVEKKGGEERGRGRKKKEKLNVVEGRTRSCIHRRTYPSNEQKPYSIEKSPAHFNCGN